MNTSSKHIVLQIWNVKSECFLRLDSIAISPSTYKDMLKNVYTDIGFVKVWYYKNNITDIVFTKMEKYVELFYDANIVFSANKQLLMKFKKECKDINTIVRFLNEQIDDCEYEDIEKCIQVKDKSKTVTLVPKEDTTQPLEYADIWNEINTVNLRKAFTVKVNDYEIEDKQYVISLQTLCFILKAVLKNSPRIDKLSTTSLDQPKCILLDEDIRLTANEIDLSVSNALWILSSFCNNNNTLFEKYLKLLIDPPSNLFDAANADLNEIYRPKNSHDLRPMLNTNFSNGPTLDTLKTTFFSTRKCNNISGVYEVPNINDIVPETRLTIPEINEVPVKQEVHEVILYENVLTLEKSIVVSLSYLLPECKVIQKISNLSQATADTYISIVNQITTLTSTLLKDCSHANDVINIITTSLSNEQSAGQQNTQQCNCSICTQDKLCEIDQKTLIHHMINMLDIKRENSWCMSNELITRAEMFINKVNDLLSNNKLVKLAKLQVAINKNNISQCFSELLEKKRRVTGMTFQCVLPEIDQIDQLAQSVYNVIENKA